MARKGTAMPMKLPSGQVVWIRVEDDEEPELPAPPAPWDAPPPSYESAPSPGSSVMYMDVPMPPPPAPGSPYAYDRPYPPLPATGAPPPPPAPYQPAVPDQWTPSPAGTAPDMPPGAPPRGWAGLLRHKKVVPTPEDARPLQGFTEAVSGIAESVREGLRHAKPDTVEIEFGLDIDVSAGAAVSLIADARAKAAVRITLGWDNREHAGGPPRVIEGSSVGTTSEESGGSSE
ncbi:CU044_2847 family protein [Actinospica robiniae]|uniref:CU044_2847 family protein n=1 Tax=Actinospica robiniae TaxID=304901 RepID=UPI0006889C89|nr:CU044_2847 family protein [Actinospica robiniae]